LAGLQFLVGAALIVTVIALLVRHWLRASTAHRRAVAPVLVAGCATLAGLTWTIVEVLLGSPFGALPANVYFILMATVPVAVLFGFLQRRLARGMVAGLVVELGGPSANRRLPDQIESAGYFMASEALTNAAKHSHGKEVRVTASYDGQRLTVQIADDGIGGATTTGGSGLRGLADRVEALGGRFTVSSPPGRGTLLRADIPCA
jgi:hypothetical protein